MALGSFLVALRRDHVASSLALLWAASVAVLGLALGGGAYPSNAWWVVGWAALLYGSLAFAGWVLPALMIAALAAPEVKPNPVGRRRLTKNGWIATGLASVLAAMAAAGAIIWSAPRADIPLPSKDATPEQVVRAYVDAVNARDFSTSNAIDARQPDLEYGRFSFRPPRAELVRFEHTTGDSDHAHVVFTARFSGGDGSMSSREDLWGYVLERGPDGRWYIVDAGVG